MKDQSRNLNGMEKILNEVLEERKRQNVKWGEQNHSLTTWISILTEEVGEAAKEAVDYCCQNKIKDWDGAWTNPTKEEQLKRLQDYRKELIQAAAVAMQMIESVDRNELSTQK